jgi:septal ring factor EnvC (AmiA/AmiB activator)
MPSILQHLRSECSAMTHIVQKHTPMIQTDQGPGKLNEIFARIFQSLNDKIKQLSSKISNLQSHLNSFDWRISQIENANIKLRGDLDNFKSKIEEQQDHIGNLTYI